MSSIDRTEHKVTFQELADKIASAPGRWVLFLGTGVAVTCSAARRQELSVLARQACETDPDSRMVKDIHKAVQTCDFAKLSDALFGGAWDDSGFLDTDRERNIKLRRIYKEGLRGKDEINIHDVPAINQYPHLGELIGKFRGIILTTCQDDTVEAFWEYENSLPADTIVHTPQLIANSNDWSRWLHATEDEVAYMRSQSELPLNPVVLVKLFGTRDEPTKLLLSEQDMEKYYPSWTEQQPDGCVDKNSINTNLFLFKILNSYNILLIGVDLENDWLLGAAKGILKCLEREPQAGVGRYALLCGKFNCNQYHIQTVAGDWDSQIVDNMLTQRHYSQIDCAARQAVEAGENALLYAREEILGLFWLFYNRRPRKLFLPEGRLDSQNSMYNAHTMEYNVLKRDILGFGDDGKISREWNRKNIRQLAIAANNFSDFYDFRDAVELARVREEESYETTIKALLSSRFSEKSLFLYRILQRYGSGFPIGFLQLLSTEKCSLKAWKRAAIQLANSGVYVQRHGKQSMYERLSYADSVMRTAGSSLFQARICNEIAAIGYQSMYSYFYPFYKVEIEKSNQIQDQEIDACFVNMFRTLYEILRDKSEEYHQIHSLLQTELPIIVQMMSILLDKNLDENLEWMPGLLYYLLRESRVCVKDKELLDCCESLKQKCEELKCQKKGESQWQLLCVDLILHQVKALIKSQSFEMEKQRESESECNQVEKIVFNTQKEQKLWKGEMPGYIFEYRISAYFLRSTIFGRMSTICEIKRCEDKVSECVEQRDLLEKMKECLNCAKNLIEKRERTLGEEYKELRSELARLEGEYCFKMSQYYDENRRFAKMDQWAEEVDCYQKAKEAYMNALEYYNRNPTRYWVQRADAMRNIADMYCHWARSMADVSEKSQSAERDFQNLVKKCYENLINAYILYRSHADLHGIADVLQSMGQIEGYNKDNQIKHQHRTRRCYYKAAKNLYQHLGDAWNSHVVSSFLEGCLD